MRYALLVMTGFWAGARCHGLWVEDEICGLKTGDNVLLVTKK